MDLNGEKIINGRVKLSDSIYKKCKNSKMIATSCGLKFESISHAIKFLGKPNEWLQKAQS